MFFVSFFGGGLEICFCNFYEINSSQDLFLYCENFGVEGSVMPKLIPPKNNYCNVKISGHTVPLREQRGC